MQVEVPAPTVPDQLLFSARCPRCQGEIPMPEPYIIHCRQCYGTGYVWHATSLEAIIKRVVQAFDRELGALVREEESDVA